MKRKNLLCLVFALVMMFSLSTTLFADKKQPGLGTSGVFDVKIQPAENQIAPASTWIGNAGVSRLDYMGFARAFSWSIDVTQTSVLPLVFTGTVDIYTASTGSYRGTVYLSGSGFGSASGVTYIPSGISLRSGTNYIARFSGTATNTAGQIFTVVPNASINFLYT